MDLVEHNNIMREEDDKTIGHNSLRSNTVTPNVLFAPRWLRDDQQSSVEIIELNSSNEMATSPKETKTANINSNDQNHAWSYTNDEDLKQMAEKYKMNTTAREKHRFQNAKKFTLPSTYMSTETDDYNNAIANNFYTNQSNNHVDDEIIFNQQMNCFTIINKHIIDTDTSTEEDYGDVEMITSNDIIIDRVNWDQQNDTYNEDIITYDNDAQNTRTIWIYSYKNRNFLPEDNVDGTNIHSKMSDSSSSYSTDSSGEQYREKNTTTNRLGSPIAATYIPRLDLSLVPTLSTVTEISERNTQHTPKESIRSSILNKKATNNWCSSESAKLAGVRSVRKLEKSTNIINWMGLSPREKRRVLKDKSSSDTWVGSRLNLADICTENNLDKHGDQTNNIVQNEGVKVLVDVEVHVDNNEKIENTTVAGQDADISHIEDISTINQIKYIDVACEFQKDRGDHYVKQVVATTIRRSPEAPKFTKIDSESFELDDSSEALKNREEKVTKVYDYILDSSDPALDYTNTDVSVDHVWMKNTIPFLKPAQWTQFIPITESPVSYYLSLGSIEEEHQTWYKRFINFFNCCK